MDTLATAAAMDSVEFTVSPQSDPSLFCGGASPEQGPQRALVELAAGVALPVSPPVSPQSSLVARAAAVPLPESPSSGPRALEKSVRGAPAASRLKAATQTLMSTVRMMTSHLMLATEEARLKAIAADEEEMKRNFAAPIAMTSGVAGGADVMLPPGLVPPAKPPIVGSRKRGVSKVHRSGSPKEPTQGVRLSLVFGRESSLLLTPGTPGSVALKRWHLAYIAAVVSVRLWIDADITRRKRQAEAHFAGLRAGVEAQAKEHESRRLRALNGESDEDPQLLANAADRAWAELKALKTEEISVCRKLRVRMQQRQQLPEASRLAQGTSGGGHPRAYISTAESQEQARQRWKGAGLALRTAARVKLDERFRELRMLTDERDAIAAEHNHILAAMQRQLDVKQARLAFAGPEEEEDLNAEITLLSLQISLEEDRLQRRCDPIDDRIREMRVKLQETRQAAGPAADDVQKEFLESMEQSDPLHGSGDSASSATGRTAPQLLEAIGQVVASALSVAATLEIPASPTLDTSARDTGSPSADRGQRYEDLKRLEHKLEEKRKQVRELSKEIEARSAELDAKDGAFCTSDIRALELRTKAEELNARETAIAGKQRVHGGPEDRRRILDQKAESTEKRRKHLKAVLQEFLSAQQDHEKEKAALSRRLQVETAQCDEQEKRLREEQESLHDKLAECHAKLEQLRLERRGRLEGAERQEAVARSREQQLRAERAEISREHEDLAQRHADWQLKEAQQSEKQQKLEALKSAIDRQRQELEHRTERLKREGWECQAEIERVDAERIAAAEEKQQLDRQLSAAAEEEAVLLEQSAAAEAAAQRALRRAVRLTELEAATELQGAQLVEFKEEIAGRSSEISKLEAANAKRRSEAEQSAERLHRADRELQASRRRLEQLRTALARWVDELRWRDAELAAAESELRPGAACARDPAALPAGGPARFQALKRSYIDGLHLRRVQQARQQREAAAEAVLKADCGRLAPDFRPQSSAAASSTVGAATPLGSGDPPPRVRLGGLLGECDREVLQDAARNVLKQEVQLLSKRFAESMAQLREGGALASARDGSHCSLPLLRRQQQGDLLLAEEREAQLQEEVSLLSQGLRRCPLLNAKSAATSRGPALIRVTREWWDDFCAAVAGKSSKAQSDRAQALERALEVLADNAPEMLSDAGLSGRPTVNPEQLTLEARRQRVEDADALLALQQEHDAQPPPPVTISAYAAEAIGQLALSPVPQLQWQVQGSPLRGSAGDSGPCGARSPARVRGDGVPAPAPLDADFESPPVRKDTRISERLQAFCPVSPEAIAAAMRL